MTQCTAPPPARWFLDCGPWRPGMPLHWRVGDRSLEPLNRDPGEYSACDGSEWYRGERCPRPRSRVDAATPTR